MVTTRKDIPFLGHKWLFNFLVPTPAQHMRMHRQKIAENPEWLATAEAQRQEVLARLIDSDKPALPVRMVHGQS
jgi:hypothetical protein